LGGKKRVSVKMLALLLTLVLLIGCAAGGTIAWLVTKTETVTNTFTASDISISLTESENLNLQMVPGNEINKDPKVKVNKGSEPCYLFIKVEAKNGVVPANSSGTYGDDTYVIYTIAEGWESVTGVDNVYYRIVDASQDSVEFDVLSGNKVHVLNTVTKSMMEAIDGKDAEGNSIQTEEKPELKFTAYAVQCSGFDTAELAWVEALELD